MVTLHEVLKQAETEGVAVGHFNVSDLVTLKAVFESASDQNVPVIVGVSEGERQFLGVRRQSINDQREAPTRGGEWALDFGRPEHEVATDRSLPAGFIALNPSGARSKRGNVLHRYIELLFEPAKRRGKEIS